MNHGTLIELIWTISPGTYCINNIPIVKLLYLMDDYGPFISYIYKVINDAELPVSVFFEWVDNL